MLFSSIVASFDCIWIENNCIPLSETSRALGVKRGSLGISSSEGTDRMLADSEGDISIWDSDAYS